MIMKHPSHFRRRTPDLRLTMAPRGGKMGMGRSPAARAKMAMPRTNINDVRVKGFENHADRSQERLLNATNFYEFDMYFC